MMDLQTGDMFFLLMLQGLVLCIHGQERETSNRQNIHPAEANGNTPVADAPVQLPTIIPQSQQLELPEIRVSCPMRYKCEERFGLPLNYHDKNCYCDTLCETYGDCCRDNEPNPQRPAARRKKLTRNMFSCQRVEEIDRHKEIYVVDSCPRDFSDEVIQKRCESAILSDDAYQRIPVTSKETGVLYKNFYCAQCDGVFNVSFWKVLLNCEHIPEPPTNISSESMLQGTVKFARENRQFCGIVFDAPSPRLKARTCKSNIGRCDRSYPDKKLFKKCRSPTSYVYVGLEVFKNKHCALCNYVNESYLSCEDTRTPRILFEEMPLISSPYSILLDLNTGVGSISENRLGPTGQIDVSEVAAAHNPCPENHIYDHFRAECRMLVCTGSYHVVGGDCLPISTESNPTSQTNKPKIDSLTQMSEVLEPEFEWIDPTRDPRLEGIDIDIPEGYRYDNEEVDDLYLDGNVPDTNPRPDIVIPSDPNLMVIDPHQDYKPGSDLQLDCPLIILNDTEFMLFENHSIYVYGLNQMFHAHQIKYNGRSASICSPNRHLDAGSKVNNNSAALNATVIMFNFTYLQSFISFVALLVSMMALIIMFVMYLVFKPLRNIAGKCALSLAFCLFAAQGLFLFGLLRTENHDICLALGALMHYFFLAGFFWLNVMSLDIYRTFSEDYEPPASPGEGCRYAGYCLYAWLAPACIVGISLSLDFFHFAEDIYQPHYAEHICWIVRRYALLFLFALPLAILLAINIILYIATLIRSISANKEKGRGRLLLYIQLSFIMGLTWIFAFIATLMQMWVFWYVFIAFNSLQGIFICFAFVCNRKVFRIIKRKGKVHKKDVRFSNGHHRTFSSARHTFLSDGEARIIAQETSI